MFFFDEYKGYDIYLRVTFSSDAEPLIIYSLKGYNAPTFVYLDDMRRHIDNEIFTAKLKQTLNED